MFSPRHLLSDYLFGEHRGRGLADRTALSVAQETSVTLVPSLGQRDPQRDLVAADPGSRDTPGRRTAPAAPDTLRMLVVIEDHDLIDVCSRRNVTLAKEMPGSPHAGHQRSTSSAVLYTANDARAVAAQARPAVQRQRAVVPDPHRHAAVVST